MERHGQKSEGTLRIRGTLKDPGVGHSQKSGSWSQMGWCSHKWWSEIEGPEIGGNYEKTWVQSDMEGHGEKCGCVEKEL